MVSMEKDLIDNSMSYTLWKLLDLNIAHTVGNHEAVTASSTGWKYVLFHPTGGPGLEVY